MTSSSPESSAPRTQPRKNRGSSDEAAHVTMSGERFEKSVSETWNASVSRAPASVDTMPPRLKIDMSAANSAPSMPGGQIFAASTRSGRKPTSPRADWTTSSPSEKRRSSRPQARFACETSASGARPMIADATDDQRMTLLSRASLKRPLYAATPTSPATDPAASCQHTLGTAH